MVGLIQFLLLFTDQQMPFFTNVICLEKTKLNINKLKKMFVNRIEFGTRGRIYVFKAPNLRYAGLVFGRAILFRKKSEFILLGLKNRFSTMNKHNYNNFISALILI